MNWAFYFQASVQAALGSWLVQKFSSMMSETVSAQIAKNLPGLPGTNSFTNNSVD